MEEKLNQIVAWLVAHGINASIKSYPNTDRKQIVFYVDFADFTFCNGTAILWVDIEPFCIRNEWNLYIRATNRKDFQLPFDRESISKLYNLIIGEWAKVWGGKHIDTYEYAKRFTFNDSFNILCSKKVENEIVKKIISSQGSAKVFFESEKSYKDKLLQLHEIVNINTNSDLFYEILFPTQTKVEVDKFLESMAHSLCEKPPKLLIGGGDVPTEIQEQRSLFIGLIKDKILLMKIRELLPQNKPL